MKAKRRFSTGKKYPSLDVLLELAKNEYKYEEERGKIFDTRSGFCLAFIAACLTFLASMINGLNENTRHLFLESTFGCIYFFGALLFLGLGLIFFLISLSARDYQRISVHKNIAFINYPTEKYKENILQQINEYIESNAVETNKKAKFCQYGLYCILIAIVFCVLMLVLKFFN